MNFGAFGGGQTATPYVPTCYVKDCGEEVVQEYKSCIYHRNKSTLNKLIAKLPDDASNTLAAALQWLKETYEKGGNSAFHTAFADNLVPNYVPRDALCFSTANPRKRRGGAGLLVTTPVKRNATAPMQQEIENSLSLGGSRSGFLSSQTTRAEVRSNVSVEAKKVVKSSTKRVERHLHPNGHTFEQEVELTDTTEISIKFRQELVRSWEQSQSQWVQREVNAWHSSPAEIARGFVHGAARHLRTRLLAVPPSSTSVVVPEEKRSTCGGVGSLGDYYALPLRECYNIHHDQWTKLHVAFQRTLLPPGWRSLRAMQAWAEGIARFAATLYARDVALAFEFVAKLLAAGLSLLGSSQQERASAVEPKRVPRGGGDECKPASPPVAASNKPPHHQHATPQRRSNAIRRSGAFVRLPRVPVVTGCSRASSHAAAAAFAPTTMPMNATEATYERLRADPWGEDGEALVELLDHVLAAGADDYLGVPRDQALLVVGFVTDFGQRRWTKLYSCWLSAQMTARSVLGLDERELTTIAASSSSSSTLMRSLSAPPLVRAASQRELIASSSSSSSSSNLLTGDPRLADNFLEGAGAAMMSPTTGGGAALEHGLGGVPVVPSFPVLANPLLPEISLVRASRMSRTNPFVQMLHDHGAEYLADVRDGPQVEVLWTHLTVQAPGVGRCEVVVLRQVALLLFGEAFLRWQVHADGVGGGNNASRSAIAQAAHDAFTARPDEPVVAFRTHGSEDHTTRIPLRVIQQDPALHRLYLTQQNLYETNAEAEREAIMSAEYLDKYAQALEVQEQQRAHTEALLEARSATRG